MLIHYAAQTPARRVRLDNGEKREPIRVVLRVRPMKDEEKVLCPNQSRADSIQAAGSCMVVPNESTVHIKAPKDAARQDEATFSFTRVLDPNTSQQQVFEVRH